MKTSHQLVAVGLLLGTAVLLITTWAILLYKQHIGVPMISQTRPIPTPPHQPVRVPVIVKPALRNIHGYELTDNISKDVVDKFAELKKRNQQHEKELSQSRIEQEDRMLRYEEERIEKERQARNEEERKRTRFRRVKQILFDMEIITPEEWGRIVTGYDPITRQIEEMLMLESELTAQDYEEIKGNVNGIRKTVETLQMFEEAIARNEAEKKAEKAAAAARNAELGAKAEFDVKVGESELTVNGS